MGKPQRGGRDRALRPHALQRPVAAQPPGAHPRPASSPGEALAGGRERLPLDVRRDCTATAPASSRRASSWSPRASTRSCVCIVRPRPWRRSSRSRCPTTGRLGTREIFWPDRMERLESEVFDGREIAPRQPHRRAGGRGAALHLDRRRGRPALECDAFGNFVLRLDQPGAPRSRATAAAHGPTGGSP